MPTIIAYHPTGFEIRFDVESGGVDALLTKLEKYRYRPSREIQLTPEGTPICPRHGVPMTKREKQGDVWYSHKVADPVTGQTFYCRGYPGPSSPGYMIAPSPPAPAAPGQTAQSNRQMNGRSVPTTTGHQPTRPPDPVNTELFG